MELQLAAGLLRLPWYVNKNIVSSSEAMFASLIRSLETPMGFDSTYFGGG